MVVIGDQSNVRAVCGQADQARGDRGRPRVISEHDVEVAVGQRLFIERLNMGLKRAVVMGDRDDTDGRAHESTQLPRAWR